MRVGREYAGEDGGKVGPDPADDGVGGLGGMVRWVWDR